MALTRREAELRLDPEHVPGASADPEDDDLVALARVGGADLLVSGDTHLTGLETRDLRVMAPGQLVDLL